ncbi:transglycosylase domain-containing protein [Nocardiopsis potens]|uniref:transglycosylase domain-containing protein n=1 Tax=Nocardiopsis potens TaxID=1246458 RepID=UPI00034BF314|nr:transglycosylase domain-containing protein [Nocardiopsis potens]
MSTERRRNAGGGRRRASGPDDGPRGSGGRRRADGPPRDERAGGRRAAPSDDGGFWDDERPTRRRSAEARSGGSRSEGGGRRRPPEERRGRDRGREAEHGARSGGSRRAQGGGGRRRPPSRRDEPDDRGPVKRFFAKVWKPALITCGVLFAGGVAALAIFYFTLGDAEDMQAQADAVKEASVITDAGGEKLITTGEVNRQNVTRDEIPDSVVNGVLGTEQRTFPSDGGISITGTMRAVLSGGSAGGGSTITQQMARNYYDGLSQEQTYTRKLKEILISIKLGNQLSKDQIITQYLNTIYFGRNAYGVQAAAQAYFGKDVKDLDDAEGAFIGAIIQQPGNFENYEADPKMQEILEERWREDTLHGMNVMYEEYDGEYGLPKEETDKLEFPETVKYTVGGEDYSGYKGYVRNAVLAEAESRYGVSPEQITKGGYQISTSLEPKLMTAASEAFTQALPEGMPEDTNYGLTAVDPATGEIKAFNGGSDFTTDANNSLTERAQAGSAFKPYVLATGLSNGISLNSKFDGNSPQTFEGIEGEIQNDSNKSWGTVDLVESTKHSVNTSFVELTQQVGAQAVKDTALAAGIAEEQLETAQLGPNIALGTYQVRALDQATGFATFANQGVHIPPHMITKMVDPNGNEVTPNDAEELEGVRAFEADVAADATYAMQQVVSPDGGGKEAMLSDGRPVAGKTGTSNDAKSAWFVGYTPQMSTAVGLFRDGGKQLEIPGVQDVYGGTTSAKIWKAFMEEAMKGVEVKQFPPRAGVGDDQSFLPATPTPPPSGEPSAPPPSQEPEESPDPSTSPPMSPPPATEEPCIPFPGNDCETGEPEEPGGPGGPGGPGDGEDDNGGGGGGGGWDPFARRDD